MKKVLFLVLSVIIIQQASAQSFDKGSLVTSFNFGLDVYNLKEHYVNKVSGQTSNNDTAKAGSFNYNLGVEYGLFKWLGAGLQFKFDNYIHDNNTTSDIGFEVGILLNAHIIRAKHFDIFAGIDAGLSTLTINYADNGTISNAQVYGSGSWFDFHITPRFYFGRFGLNLNLYFPAINYANLTSNVDTFNQYIAASWNAKGTGFTIGLQYRILN